MQVTITESTSRKIVLDKQAIYEVTIKNLKSLVNYGDYLRTRGDKLFLVEEIDNYHGSPSEKVIREATELDIAVFKVMDVLKSNYNKYIKEKYGNSI